jgi:hypothetical protein
MLRLTHFQPSLFAPYELCSCTEIGDWFVLMVVNWFVLMVVNFLQSLFTH